MEYMDERLPGTFSVAPPYQQRKTCSDCIVWVLSKFNGTSTPKGSYRAKTRDNDCNVNSSRYSLSTVQCVRAFAIRPSLNKMSDKTWYPGWAMQHVYSDIWSLKMCHLIVVKLTFALFFWELWIVTSFSIYDILRYSVSFFFNSVLSC